MLKIIWRLLPDLESSLSDIFGSFFKPATVLIDIALWIVIAKVAKIILLHISHHGVKRRMDQTSRYKTVDKLAGHVITTVVWFFAVAAILGELEMTTTVTGMLATAGIGGIAIGLGAQSLIGDMINGSFMLGEKQFEVGDFICIADKTGTVEDVHLRTTSLRATSGELYIIPNGTVKSVTNYSRGTNRAIVDVPVPYGIATETIIDILKSAVNKYYGDHTNVLDAPPRVLGIVKFASSAVMIRIIAECKNLTHWETERGIRAQAVTELASNGISIPFDTIVVCHEEEKRQ